VGSSTLDLQGPPTPATTIDGFSVQAQSWSAVVDEIIVSPGATGVTVAGSIVSLESGAATLDVGTRRFAMPNATASVSAFQGGQVKVFEVSKLFLFGALISLVLI